MAFWVIVAQVLEVILAAKKLASTLSALQSGQLVEGILRSFLISGITDGLTKNGIPLDKLFKEAEKYDPRERLKFLDLKAQAESWANSILKEAGSDFAKHSILIAPDRLEVELTKHLERLMSGKTIANGTPAIRNQTRTADPVVLPRGEFEREVVDLEVSGAGMDFVFQRTYRSGAAYLGPLGLSWDHTYNLRLRQDNEFVVVRLTGELSEDRFVQHPRFGEGEFSYFAPPDGVHDLIVPDGAESFLLKRPQGTTFHYEATSQAGEHRIRRVEDRFGNFLDFGYSEEDLLKRVFINSASRHVSFTYNEMGRLARIEDHTGRSVVYSYDEWGYLAVAEGPALPGEKPIGLEYYEYDQVGQVRKLVRVWDWNNRIVVENEYEQDELSDYFGYIVRQIVNRGESSFTYESLHEEVDPTVIRREVPTLRVWESQRSGHQVERLFNNVGNELLTRECYVEGCRMREAVTRFRYNPDGQIIARLDPDGALTQYLFGRDHLADSIPQPDIEYILGDVPMKDRMSFGNLLATNIRGRRVTSKGTVVDPNFWEQVAPLVKVADHTEDVVTKYRYDRDSQCLLSFSDPRHTASADPVHVESLNPEDPAINPVDPQFITHQHHLTRFEYGLGPRFEIRRIIFPNRTRPSTLDGVGEVTEIVEEMVEYDANGRLLRRLDTRGYEWIDEYYITATDAKEGFLRRRLVPHLDLLLSKNTPDILEIQRNGTWQASERFLLSSGTIGDVITIAVEGVQIMLYQSQNLTEIPAANAQVAVSIDGISTPPWNQATEATYLIDALSRGVHLVELRDDIGASIAIGMVRSHVSLEYEVDDLGRILQERDARGNLKSSTFDALGHITKISRGAAVNPSINLYEYDPEGNLIFERAEWRDENGESRPEGAILSRYRYDIANLLLAESKETEHENTKRIVNHRYDSEGNLYETINARGNHTYFRYDELNRQILTIRAACSPDCSVITTSYDLANHVLSQRDPRGSVHFNGYLDSGGVWQPGINTRGQIRIHTDPLGHMVVTDYDARDNETVVRHFQRRTDNGFDLLSRQATEYDEDGEVIRITDAVFKKPILTTDPVHAPDSEFGTSVNAGDVQRASTEYHLDANGNRIAVRKIDAGIERQRFDGQNRVCEVLDAVGRRIYKIFDGNGNLFRVYAFEPVREPESGDILNHEVFIQEYEYDELNREVTRTDAYGNRWLQRYDTLGNKTFTSDPLGNIIHYRHNAFGEEFRRTHERTQTGLGGDNPLPALITERAYDQKGNIIAIIDPLQRRTEYQFDALDRMVESRFAVSPNEPKEKRSYDPADNLVSITTQSGLVRKMQYDHLNRLIRTDIDTSGVAPVDALSPLSSTFSSLTYDAAGNRIRHENNYCVCITDRDSRGLPFSETIQIQNIAGAPGPLEISQQFDLAGRRTKLFYPSGRIVSYEYDFLGRVITVQNLTSPLDYPGRESNRSDFGLARYTYRGRRLIQVDFGNQLALTFRFEGRGNILERSVSNGNAILWRFQQLRDAVGFTRLESAVTRTGERSRKFALDSIYRLTHYQDEAPQWIDPHLVEPPHAPVNPQETTGQSLINSVAGLHDIPVQLPAFKYDEVGNRLVTSEPGVSSFSSMPNSLNQYTSVDGNIWLYDASGNLRLDATRSYAYDQSNALQEITDTGTSLHLATYYRDALGRVVAETTVLGTAFRVYDGTSPLVEITGMGRMEFTTGHHSEIVQHAALAGEDYWLIYDGLNSLRLLTDGAGNVVSMPLFRPFGASEDTELILSPFHFGFAGMWYTRDIPLYHTDYRSYRPDIGRHLQRDPAGFVDDLNLYLYVKNNPVNYWDPTGLQLTNEDIELYDYLQKLADNTELTSAHEGLSPAPKGTRAHLDFEAAITFPAPNSGLSSEQLERLAPEVHIDEKGIIRAVGAGPEKAKEGWRTVDLLVVRSDVPGGRTTIIGQKATDVIDLAVDYKTGKASLEKVKELEALIGKPVVKLTKGGNLTAMAEKKTLQYLAKLLKKGGKVVKYGSKVLPLIGAGVTYLTAEGSQTERVVRAAAGEIQYGPVDLEMAYDASTFIHENVSKEYQQIKRWIKSGGPGYGWRRYR